ncbi:HNH endonuclease signature motif containing protein [Nocardioides plantarum]
MSFSSSPSTHPVLACASALGAALDEVATVDPLFMTTPDKESALLDLTAIAARLDELRLRVLNCADDVAATHGARDAGAWLAHQARLDHQAGRRDLTAARSLTRHPRVADALRAGTIDRARAHVVMSAVDALPTHVDPDTRTRAEAHLLEQARAFDPTHLRVLGRRVLAVVAPEVDDAHEARLLAAEEARAQAVTSLTTRRRGDGTTDIRIRCADTTADRLLTYLQSLTSPRQGNQGDQSSDDPRPYPQRLGHAFATFLETVDPTRLPLHGGDATTVIVTLDLATLLSQLGEPGVALIGDQPITAAHARRLACTAHLVPAVLDGDSHILDLGRSQRLYNRHQRKAMALRDTTCRASGCTIPAAWCEAHHLTPWTHGGPTNLDDGILLCPHHHHLAHDHRYDMQRHPDGTLTFHRRT